MKKLMMVCALVFSVITYANAQQGGGQRGGGMRRQMLTPEQSVSKMDSVVKLSADQKTKMLAVFTESADARKKMMADMQGGGGDRDAMMQKMQEARKRKVTTEKTNAILTADQQKLYADYEKEMRDKMMKERQAQGGGNN